MSFRLLALSATLLFLSACGAVEANLKAGGQRITLGNGNPGWELACLHTTDACQVRAAEICAPNGYSIYATTLKGRGVGLSKRGVRMQIECL